MDPEELGERRRVAKKDAASLRRAVPQITLLNEPLRHRDGDGSLTAEAWAWTGTRSNMRASVGRQVEVAPHPSRGR
jgi:hypothetical protein